MKRQLLLISVIFSMQCIAQNRYEALYWVKTTIGFYSDSYKTESPGGVFRQVWSLRTDSAKAYLNCAAPPEYFQLKKKTGARYDSGRWQIFDYRANSYRDAKPFACDFFYTGKKKEILGYSCDEAIASDSSKIIVWVCKDLPEMISPKISAKNIHHAILGYENPNQELNIILIKIGCY